MSMIAVAMVVLQWSVFMTRPGGQIIDLCPTLSFALGRHGNKFHKWACGVHLKYLTVDFIVCKIVHANISVHLKCIGTVVVNFMVSL